MRKSVWSVLLAGLLTMTGCTFETSDNGSLDGYWQLTSVDSLANPSSTDMRESGFYWAVQARLLEVRNVKTSLVRVFFRFERTDGKLILSNPVASERLEGDSMITDVTQLRPYGLTRLNDTLEVLRLDNERMILESEIVRMHFRKY